jgi:hypothetical protein
MPGQTREYYLVVIGGELAGIFLATTVAVLGKSA